MSKALRYEHFVRGAFEFATNRTVDRGGDPAHLAEADLFNISSYFPRVKVGTAYAMEIYSSYIKENCDISNEEYHELNTFTENVLNANSHDELYNLIHTFTANYVNRYIYRTHD